MQYDLATTRRLINKTYAQRNAGVFNTAGKNIAAERPDLVERKREFVRGLIAHLRASTKA